MKRRDVLKGLLLLAVVPFRFVRAATGGKKYVLIHDGEYDELVRQADRSLTQRDPFWNLGLEIWDVRRDAERVRDFVGRYGRNTRDFQWPVLLAVPETGDSEVEVWTTAWLNFQDGCYPISGGWWSVEGDWHPTIEKVRTHVATSLNHASGKFDATWLHGLKFEELQSLHSDHHREMTKAGKVLWDYVNKECPIVEPLRG